MNEKQETRQKRKVSRRIRRVEEAMRERDRFAAKARAKLSHNPEAAERLISVFVRWHALQARYDREVRRLWFGADKYSIKRYQAMDRRGEATRMLQRCSMVLFGLSRRIPDPPPTLTADDE